MLSLEMKDLDMKVIIVSAFYYDSLGHCARQSICSGWEKKEPFCVFFSLVCGYLSEGREALHQISQLLFCHFYLCST